MPSNTVILSVNTSKHYNYLLTDKIINLTSLYDAFFIQFESDLIIYFQCFLISIILRGYDLSENSKEKIISKIILFNRAWKLAQQHYGVDSPISGALRDQKSCLQAEFLRYYGNSYLVLDSNEEGEKLYSVKIGEEIFIDSLGTRTDAEHLPERIAKQLFTTKELAQLIRE